MGSPIAPPLTMVQVLKIVALVQTLNIARLVDNSQKHAIKTGMRDFMLFNGPTKLVVTLISPFDRYMRTTSNWRDKSQANKS